MAEDASKFVLLPSPNWYCSSVADCSLTKIYAFGARNCVYLLDVSSDKPVFHGQLVGHTERVSSVCFSKHKLHANFVASGSDDKTVKIWDTDTKLKLLEHKAHNVRTVIFFFKLYVYFYLFIFALENIQNNPCGSGEFTENESLLRARLTSSLLHCFKLCCPLFPYWT